MPRRGRPAAADDERAGRRLLERQPAADVLHHRRPGSAAAARSRSRAGPRPAAGSCRPTSAAIRFAQAPAALTSRRARIEPRPVCTVKRCAPGRRATSIAGDRGVGADRGAVLERPHARTAARPAAGWRGPRAGSTTAPARSSARNGANARSSSPTSTCGLEAGVAARSRCFSRSSCSSCGVSATISPPVMWTSSGPSSSSLELRPERRRAGQQPHLVEQPLAHRPPVSNDGELVDRDLEVEAPGVRAGGLAVQLAALDQRDLDALRAR